MGKTGWMVAAALSLGVVACGGGGGGSSSTVSTTGNSSNSNGTSGDAVNSGSVTVVNASAVPTSSSAINTVPVTVSSAGFQDQPMVKVTVCAPNSNAASSCTTISNVLVDTGSYGLRVFASALPATLGALTARTDSLSGKAVTECVVFASGHAWGSVRGADVRIGNETAIDLPVHILADPSLPAEPSACAVNTAIAGASDLGANGILGVGVKSQDCGAPCVTNSLAWYYFATDSTSSTRITVPLGNQVTNPVARFATDNNGVILEMPQVPDSGTAVATGTLVFGIDTRSNNALAYTGATLLATTDGGNFNATYNGRSFTGNAFFDSGSNGLFFQDASIPSTGSFFTPVSTLGREATISASNLSGATIGFNIANASTQFGTGNRAFNNVGGYMSGSFDFGMPFFYGRHVYYGLTGQTSTGGGTGPYVAFTSS